MLGILDRKSEYDSPLLQIRSAPEHLLEIVREKDIVSQDEADVFPADKFFADDKGLGDPVRLRLLGIFEPEAEPRAIAKEVLKLRDRFGGRNDQDLPDPGHH